MKRSNLIPVLFALTATLAIAHPAVAQPGSSHGASVTIEVSNVKNSTGLVLGNLCAEGGGPFPGPCFTHMAMARAEQGTTLLGFYNVMPGRYALQVFHDEDGNMTPGFPQEGVALGNNFTGRPTWEAAAITVAGPMTVDLTMRYLSAAEAPKD